MDRSWKNRAKLRNDDNQETSNRLDLGNLGILIPKAKLGQSFNCQLSGGIKMRRKMIVLLGVTILAVGLTGAGQQRRSVDDREYTEREDINQTYELSAGARVELSVISGSVDVETTNGNTAQVHIVRMGETRADLDCYKIAIEHTPNSLIMRHRQERTAECENIRAKQIVTLRLPRNVDLKLNAISGPVTIGELDGTLRLSGISGRVEVAQALGYSEISGISGVLSISVPRLSERGMRVSGISGKVELRLANSLNADLNVSGVNGDVDAAAPNVSLSKVGHSRFAGRVGSGGSVISVSGISGSVTFRGE
jgi:hypothetical protein